MREALHEAARAAELGEVPVGAVIVRGEAVLGRGHNRRGIDQDPCGHAEILAIREAAAALGDWRLEESRLYVTLEPCAMCAGAIVLARIPQVIYGVRDPKAGAAGSLMNLLVDERLNHRAEIIEGILEEECGAVLREFFRVIREKSRNERIEENG